jgi:predicted MFS family arabinose efflux permease
MRVAYGIVVALFLVAASLRFRLKETFVNTPRPSWEEFFRSYPTSLKESVKVWKRVPRSMLYLFLSGTVMMFGVSAVQLYLVDYAVNILSVDEAVWAYVLTVLPITMIILSVPIGKIVDKFNRRVPILFSYTFIFSALLLFVHGNLVLLFVSLMFLGAGLVMFNSGFGALQADLTPRDCRGKIQGFSSFVNYIVMALGTAVGGFLYEHLSPQLPFYLATLFIVPAFILTLTRVHEAEQRQE